MDVTMATNKPKATARHRIVLFGGQGTPSLFSAAAARCAEDDVNQCTAAAMFLSGCHAAFLDECLSLDLVSRRKVGLNPTDFRHPKDLLIPQQSFHDNAIIQAATICLYQLLHYLAEIERSGSSLDASSERTLETTGMCSGLLSGVVVAAAKTMQDFTSFGIAAFRLAFRIAYRSAMHGYDSDQAQNRKAPMSLLIIGLGRGQVEERLQNFCIQVSEMLRPVITWPEYGTYKLRQIGEESGFPPSLVQQSFQLLAKTETCVLSKTGWDRMHPRTLFKSMRGTTEATSFKASWKKSNKILEIGKSSLLRSQTFGYQFVHPTMAQLSTRKPRTVIVSHTG